MHHEWLAEQSDRLWRRGVLRGASSKGACGGAAVKMDEGEAFDGNRGLELPIAFSSLSRDKKWKLRSLRLLNSSRFA